MSTPALIIYPYSFGRRSNNGANRMHLGPMAIHDSPGFLEALEREFGEVPCVMIDDQDEPDPEDCAGNDGLNVAGFFPGDQMSRIWAQNARYAEEVRKARRHNQLPVGLIVGCTAAIGMVAALGEHDDIGMIWLDAHSDASTPETSRSGLLEGMPVAMITGRCWKRYMAEHKGFRPLTDERVASIGLHDTSANPWAPDDLPGLRVTPAEVAEFGFENAVETALDALREEVTSVYIHIDVDCFDPSEVRVSSYMAPGGMTFAQLDHVLAAVAAKFDVLGIDFGAFDPTIEKGSNSKLAEAVLRAVRTVTGSVDE